MLSLNLVSRGISFLCIIGICLSIYALFVELKHEEDSDYEAMCDISEHMSCSKVLGSRWGKGFGLIGPLLGEESPLNQPNSVAGILFYIILVILNNSSSSSAPKALFVLSGVSNLMSLYLASILYFILHDLCVVCISTYVVNALLLVTSYHKYQMLSKLHKKTKKS